MRIGGPRLLAHSCWVTMAVAMTMAAVTMGVGPAPPASAATVGSGGSWLDPSFGGGGGSATVNSDGHDAAVDLAVQPDGRLVVLANRTTGTAHAPVVARLTSDGSPDPTFGADGTGTVTLPQALTADGKSLAIQGDGKILVAGAQWTSGPNTRPQLFAVRLDGDGRLDPTFSGGEVTIDSPVPGGVFDGGAMALGADGSVVLAGWASADNSIFHTVVARRLADGSPDTGFGTGGVTESLVGVQPVSIAVLPGGGVIVGGRGGMPSLRFQRLNPEGFALARFGADGALDTSFGAQGISWTDFSRGVVPRDATLQRLTLQPNGRIVAVGWTITFDLPNLRKQEVAVARYRTDGALDPTFGAGGIVVTRVPPTSRTGGVIEGGGFGEALALDGAGRVLVGATATGNSDIDAGLLRYSPSGAVDTTFGRQGWTKTDLGGAEAVVDLALMPDGRPVLLATERSLESESSHVVVARYPVTPDTLGVDAWGWNAVGQLGDGTIATRPVARPSALPASAPGGVIALADGGYHSMALQVNGSVWVWGWNGYGELGDGTTTERDRPVEVPGLHDVSAVSAGLLHSLAVSGGRVYAWGWNGYGQLGDGTTATRVRPVQVPGLSDIVAVSAGAYHSLALRIDGTVWAWGWNGLGQIGDGTTVNRLAPVQVAGVFRATAVSAGAFHSLAVASEDQAHDAGSVLAWGYNGMGQAGLDGTASVLLPGVVYGLGRPVEIAAGGYHNLMLTDDGRVLAWGWNGYGQLGDGTTVQKSYPVAVPGVSDADAIATGLVHSVAGGRDGLVRSWGWNGVGQLGDATTTDRHSPVVVAGVAGASAVGAGADHSSSGLRGGP